MTNEINVASVTRVGPREFQELVDVELCIHFADGEKR
jgi:hypothetical protein